jgi:ubiquinone biosynthesis monooxygenase Coq7
MFAIDRLIAEFDRALRAVAGVVHAERRSPAEGLKESAITEEERAHAAALMRVNHVGEICAQALYQGQALTARDAGARAKLEQAAREEEDHRGWCAERIRELGGRPRLLNPAWYAGACARGRGADRLGSKRRRVRSHRREAIFPSHAESLVKTSSVSFATNSVRW